MAWPRSSLTAWTSNGFSADLLDCFRNLLLISLDGCSELVDLPEEELQRFIDLAQSVSTETIHYKLNLLMRLVEEMRGSGQPRLSLETGFLKIIEAGNVVPVTDLLGRLHLLLDADRSTDGLCAESGRTASRAKRGDAGRV